MKKKSAVRQWYPWDPTEIPYISRLPYRARGILDFMREAYFLTGEPTSKDSLMLGDDELADYALAIKVWPAVKEVMDREMAHADRISNINRINGAEGGRQAVAKRIVAEVKHIDIDIDINKDIKEEKKPAAPAIHPELAERVKDMCDHWPKVNDRGEPMPRASQSQTRAAMTELMKRGKTLEGLCISAAEYLKEFRKEKLFILKAPQFFFSKKGYWEDHYSE